MLICLFLLLSITITAYIFFGKVNLISGRFCHFGWPLSLGISPHSINLYCSLVTQVFHILMLIDSWNVWEESTIIFVCYIGSFLAMGEFFVVSASSHSELLFFRSVPGYRWYVCISAIWNTAWDTATFGSFLVTDIAFYSHLVKCFWRRPILLPMTISTFWLWYVIQSDIMSVYHSLVHLFCSFHFSLPVCINIRDGLSCNRIQFPWSFLILMWLVL